MNKPIEAHTEGRYMVVSLTTSGILLLLAALVLIVAGLAVGVRAIAHDRQPAPAPTAPPTLQGTTKPPTMSRPTP
jgi:hypothetical protein